MPAISFLALASVFQAKKGFQGAIDDWHKKLLLTLRLNYDEYGNHRSVDSPKPAGATGKIKND
ncbi:MAG TPA: hypothetical protein VNY07_02210 [Chthoniobacterales bacterium]|jgi:hypothetical protein|nr:hypothetical protein [Chthoniobacterales bacterium]